MSEYVKFKYGRASDEIAPFDEFAELNECRRKLLELQLIGVRSNGVSFGNLSVRDGVTNNFYVTGSATGALSELTLADCAKVVAYDFKRNWLRYEGAAIPSSESLTHARNNSTIPDRRGAPKKALRDGRTRRRHCDVWQGS